MQDTSTATTGTSPRGWLRNLRCEAEERAARIAPLAGRVRPAQRPWSAALDRLEDAEQEMAS